MLSDRHWNPVPQKSESLSDGARNTHPLCCGRTYGRRYQVAYASVHLVAIRYLLLFEAMVRGG
jgi:hypothetical protein